MKNKIDPRCLKLAADLKIKVKWVPKTSSGLWEMGRKIIVGENASNYTFLHEIGHALIGYDCCKEHCEFQVHGFAVGMLKVFGLDYPDLHDKYMNPIAGFSAHEACGRWLEHQKSEGLWGENKQNS